MFADKINNMSGNLFVAIKMCMQTADHIYDMYTYFCIINLMEIIMQHESAYLPLIEMRLIKKMCFV